MYIIMCQCRKSNGGIPDPLKCDCTTARYHLALKYCKIACNRFSFPHWISENTPTLSLVNWWRRYKYLNKLKSCDIDFFVAMVENITQNI